MGAVHVVASHNNDWQLEALHVRVYKHFSSSLACSIGIGWSQNAGLQQVVIVVLDLSIDLICGDVNESPDTKLLGTLQHDMRSIDIGVGEAIGVAETQIDVGLRCKVKNGVNVVALHAVEDLLWFCNVTMIEGEVALVVEHARIV